MALTVHWSTGLSWLFALGLAGVVAALLLVALLPFWQGLARAIRHRLALSRVRLVRGLAECEAFLVACYRAEDGGVTFAGIMSFEELAKLSPPERHRAIRHVVRNLRASVRTQSEKGRSGQAQNILATAGGSAGDLASPGETDSPQFREEPISFWGWFVSAEQEYRFRLHFLHFDTRQAMLAVGAGLVSGLAFIPADIRLLGNSDSFRFLLACRLFFAFVSVLCLVALSRKPQPKTLDRLMLGWLSLGILLMVNVGMTRVSIFFLGYAITGLIALGLLYAVVPLPLPYQVAIGALVTVVDVLILLPGHPELDLVLRNTVVVAYAIMMAVGAALSWSVRRSKRQQFSALDRETVLRVGLETALAEVKTLSGIVPICSQCRKVRQDDGYWQQVEVYVGTRTEAKFSHGLCPDCLSKLRLQQRSEDRKIERIYHCAACPKAFRVESQFGDRTAADAPEVPVKVPCPFCGTPKEITWPRGGRFVLEPAAHPSSPSDPLHRQDWRGQLRVH